MNNGRALLALAAVLALPACSTLRPEALHGPEALLSDAPRRMPERAYCRVSGHPEDLPAADAVVDSAAFTAAAAALWRAAGQPPGHVLLGLRFDREGLNVRRDVIEHRLPEALADSLQKLAFAHRRRVRPADEEWSVRLRLDLGETPWLRVGRTELCAPRLRSGPGGGMGGTFMGNGWGDGRGAFAQLALLEMDPSTIWVRVALDARGNVTEARVERSTGRRMSEMRVLNYLRTIGFVPATEDGHPVPGQLSMPLRLGP
ncbi:MAG TPA: energy transducer TonB [Longimicrobium sp.]